MYTNGFWLSKEGLSRPLHTVLYCSMREGLTRCSLGSLEGGLIDQPNHHPPKVVIHDMVCRATG